MSTNVDSQDVVPKLDDQGIMQNPHMFAQILTQTGDHCRIHFPFAGQYTRKPTPSRKLIRSTAPASAPAANLAPLQPRSLSDQLEQFQESLVRSRALAAVIKSTSTSTTLEPIFKPGEVIELFGAKIKIPQKQHTPRIQELINEDPTAIDSSTTCFRHGLWETISHAYNRHLGLTLRPDDIWLAVAQGFSHYIHSHAKQYRSLILSEKHVQKKGKIPLTAELGTDIDLSQLIPQLYQQATSHMPQESKQPLSFAPQFSTTDMCSQLACMGTTLNAVKSFFRYQMHLSCGFSELILLGTPQDWQDLKAKVQSIFQLLSTTALQSGSKDPLQAWQTMLDSVLDKFIETRSATQWTKELDDFWGTSLVNQVWGSGGDCHTYLTGWLGAILPFDRDGYLLPLGHNEVESLPLGYVSFTVEHESQHHQVDCGFFGYQVSDKGHVSTVMGCRIDLEPRDQEEDQDRDQDQDQEF